MTIGGNVTVKNSLRWDYCFEQCIKSLLPICDVVNVVDSDSDDGTAEALHRMAAANPKIRLLNYPWPGTLGNPDCLLDKMNWSRERLGTDYHLHLEADEVLGAESYDCILEAAKTPGNVLGMMRLNFWEDATKTLAEGHILSPSVIRFAPQRYWLGGDAPHPKATETEPNVNWETRKQCFIYHYGMLRHPESYQKKWVNLMQNFNGSENADLHFKELLNNSLAGKTNWMADLKLPTVPFTGKHPKSMHKWLKSRGWEVKKA